MSHFLELDFIGKDSVHYHNKIEITDEIFNIFQ